MKTNDQFFLLNTSLLCNRDFHLLSLWMKSYYCVCDYSIKVTEHFYPVIVDIVYYPAQDHG